MTRQEIIYSLKEMKDVCASFFCVIYESGQNWLVDSLCEYMKANNVKEGFGLRASQVIERLENGEEIEAARETEISKALEELIKEGMG